MIEIQTSKTEIGGIEFTGYFDYDQRRDKNIYKLSDAGKIKWFKYRAEKLFYNPLMQIFTNGTPAHEALNKDSNAFMLTAFSSLLNGVESLGSFMTDIDEFKKGKNRERFEAFIKEYMPDWKNRLEQQIGKTKTILEALWYRFRNGLAHSFVVENGSLDSRIGGDKKYAVENGEIIIHLELFIKDFELAWNTFFDDVNGKYMVLFLKRFKVVYPE